MSRGIDHRREPPRRGIPVAAGGADQGADHRATRIDVDRGRQCVDGAGGHLEIGVADEEQPELGELAATPRLTAEPYPRFSPGSTTTRPGTARSAAASEPSDEPLSTTTISLSPEAARSATHLASDGPDS